MRGVGLRTGPLLSPPDAAPASAFCAAYDGPRHARGSLGTNGEAQPGPAEAQAAPRPAGAAPALGRAEPPRAARLRREATRGEPPAGPRVPPQRGLLRRTRGMGDGLEAGPGYRRRRILQGA